MRRRRSVFSGLARVRGKPGLVTELDVERQGDQLGVADAVIAVRGSPSAGAAALRVGDSDTLSNELNISGLTCLLACRRWARRTRAEGEQSERAEIPLIQRVIVFIERDVQQFVQQQTLLLLLCRRP